jgi:hypothetical protein
VQGMSDMVNEGYWMYPETVNSEEQIMMCMIND